MTACALGQCSHTACAICGCGHRLEQVSIVVKGEYVCHDCYHWYEKRTVQESVFRIALAHLKMSGSAGGHVLRANGALILALRDTRPERRLFGNLTATELLCLYNNLTRFEGKKRELSLRALRSAPTVSAAAS